MKTLSKKNSIFLWLTHFVNVFFISVWVSVLLLFISQNYFVNQIVWSSFVIIWCIYGVRYIQNNHIIKNPLKISIISSILFIILWWLWRILNGAYGLAPELSDYQRLNITFSVGEIMWWSILLLLYFFYTYFALKAATVRS